MFISRLTREQVVTASDDVELEPSAINPEWVIEGTPQTRWRMLFSTDDGLAHTGVWDCTAGKFCWNYHCDETIHVIEGGMTVACGGRVNVVVAGDVIFFPAGTKTVWTVDNYVRKVFWLRQPVPLPSAYAVRAFNRVRYRRYRSRF